MAGRRIELRDITAAALVLVLALCLYSQDVKNAARYNQLRGELKLISEELDAQRSQSAEAD